jgi:sterol 3beta-glucosyltransferase
MTLILTGDVQPYVALGKMLQNDGHRVRIATHETFRTFIKDAGLEFFCIGGNPQDLMSYMVKSAIIIYPSS